ERVLPVEPDATPCRGLAVDVLVRVDEHAVGASEPAAERVELLAQGFIGVEPRVPRQPAVAGRPLWLWEPVAERGRDDGARTRQQLFRMARLLGPRHSEAHVREEPARSALADVALGLAVWLRPRGAARRERPVARR